MSNYLISPRGSAGVVASAIAGLLAAALLSFAIPQANTPLVFIIYLAPPLLFMAGLAAGLSGSLAALAGSCAWLMISHSGNLYVPLAWIVVYALPIAIMAALALLSRVGGDGKTYWYPAGYLLTFVVIYPCLMFIAVFALVGDNNGGLLVWSQQIIEAMIDSVPDADLPPPSTTGGDVRAEAKVALSSLIRMLPASIGSSWTFLMIMSGVIAQYALRQHNWQVRRAGFDFHDLEAPQWLVPIVIITAAVGIIFDDPYAYIALNISMMLGIALVLHGLAVIHAMLLGRRFRILLLALLYILLVLGWPAVAVAMVGVLDMWKHFRQSRHAIGAVSNDV